MKHVVEVQGDRLVIWRVHDDGSVVLLTTKDLRASTQSIDAFAAELGEVLILDNEALRIASSKNSSTSAFGEIAPAEQA